MPGPDDKTTAATKANGSTTASTTTTTTPAAAPGPGLTALQKELATCTGDAPGVDAVIHIIDDYPAEHDALFDYLNKNLGNAYVATMQQRMDSHTRTDLPDIMHPKDIGKHVNEFGIFYGDAGSKTDNFFSASVAQQGASWRDGTIDKNGYSFTGTGNKDGLKTAYDTKKEHLGLNVTQTGATTLDYSNLSASNHKQSFSANYDPSAKTGTVSGDLTSKNGTEFTPTASVAAGDYKAGFGLKDKDPDKLTSSLSVEDNNKQLTGSVSAVSKFGKNKSDVFSYDGNYSGTDNTYASTAKLTEDFGSKGGADQFLKLGNKDLGVGSGGFYNINKNLKLTDDVSYDHLMKQTGLHPTHNVYEDKMGLSTANGLNSAALGVKTTDGKLGGDLSLHHGFGTVAKPTGALDVTASDTPGMEQSGGIKGSYTGSNFSLSDNLSYKHSMGTGQTQNIWTDNLDFSTKNGMTAAKLNASSTNGAVTGDASFTQKFGPVAKPTATINATASKSATETDAGLNTQFSPSKNLAINNNFTYKHTGDAHDVFSDAFTIGTADGHTKGSLTGTSDNGVLSANGTFHQGFFQNKKDVGAVDLTGSYSKAAGANLSETAEYKPNKTWDFNQSASYTNAPGKAPTYAGNLSGAYTTDRFNNTTSATGTFGDPTAGHPNSVMFKDNVTGALGKNFYAGASGSVTTGPGMKPLVGFGANLTFTPSEQMGLTLSGIVDQTGAFDARLQLDVFKSKVNALDWLNPHKKDALISIFVGYSQNNPATRLDPMNTSGAQFKQMYNAPGPTQMPGVNAGVILHF